MREQAHLRLIRALDGNVVTGMCVCPSHEDVGPSLCISAGHKVPVLLHCFAGCTFEQITEALARRNLWPVRGSNGAAPATKPRSDMERRRYALSVLNAVRQNRGRELAYLLKDYFAARGIEAVPGTALLALPLKYSDDVLYLPTDPAMVFPITNGRRHVGIHVTWLNEDLNGKREREPQRQFFGPVAGGYIKLYTGDLDPGRPLIIAEGIETALAAMQIAGGYPAIAALSAKNMPLITPPPASEFIVAGDNDANGTGQRAARALAAKLVRGGAVVRIAIPPQPDTDWNDRTQPAVGSRRKRCRHEAPKA